MIIERIKAFAASVQRHALAFVRNWWRPIGCLSIVGGIIVNYIVVPYRAGVPSGGEGFAAVIAAFASAMAVREVGKVMGHADGAPS